MIEGQDRDWRPAAVAAFVAALAGFAACYVWAARRTGKVCIRARAAVDRYAAPAGAGIRGWRAWTRLARDRYVRLDFNDYSVHFPVTGPRTVVPGQPGKTNQVEHIPLAAGVE